MNRVTGLEKALAELHREAKKISMKSMTGLVRGGFVIQRAAQKGVPVDTANLKASAFVVFDKGKVLRRLDQIETPNFKEHGKSSRGRDALGRFTKATQGAGADTEKLKRDHKAAIAAAEGMSGAYGSKVVFVGFSASYAIFVHEDEDAEHSVGGPKFMERAITDNLAEIISAIREEAAR